MSGKTGGMYGYRGRACRGTTCSGWGATGSVSVQAIPSGAPALSAPTLSNNGSYTVSWTSVSGASSYKLEESVNGGAWILIQNSSALALAMTSKANGTYSYRATGCNAAGCGGLSAAINVRVQYPPASAPSLSTPGTSTNGSYTITWSSVATATAYRLEESAAGGGWATVYSSNGYSHAIGGKGNGSYAYRVIACNDGGCSAYSQNASVSVLLPPTAAPVLSVPATNSTGAYNVSWTAVGLATSYRLEESTNGGAWVLIHDEGSTTRALGGKASATYSYRVQACNSSGCAGWSNVASASVQRIPNIPANTYGVMDAASKTQWKISAHWEAVPEATWYELTGYFGYNGPATTSFKIVKSVHPPEEDMPFQVRACNANGCSAWSAIFYASL